MGRTVEKGLLVCVGLLLSSCGEQPSISVTSPNGGETWAAGATATVTWSTMGTVGDVMIELSTDGGGSWATFLSSTPNDGSETCTVPDSPSTQCRVRVSEASDGDPSDMSDADFTIQLTITVTAPNGSEMWIVGDAADVTWNSGGTVGDVKIELSTDSGASWTVLVPSTPNDWSETVTVPDSPSTQCRVRVSEASDGDPSDASDADFTIERPFVTVTLPALATEVDGVLTDAGMVSVPSNVTSDLAAALSSDDTTEVTVPSPVTISAGTSSTSFDVTIVNDGVVDGHQVATVTASAAGYTSASDTVMVRDVDLAGWRVDVDAPGPTHDGLSWSTAFLHPQDAMDVAISGDEVWVAEGRYTRRGGSDTVLLTMIDGAGIYGGFAGTEVLRDERDWTVYVTTLEGASLVLHVVAGASDATLDGFTINGGNANMWPDLYGGGMKNDTVTNLTVTNCTFSGNSAGWNGGGMYNTESSPNVTNCTFSGNTSDYGGGMYNYNSHPTVTDCTFSGNSSDDGGGGMYNSGSFPSVTNCTFSGNTSFYRAGAMYNSSSSPDVANCTFSGNWSARYCGGMHNTSSSPTVANCTFSDNTGEWEGGAMRNYDSSPTVTNCAFSGNTSEDGGAMYNYDHSSPAVTNCTFSGNSGDYGDVMCDLDYSSPAVTNCILWGNSAFGGEIYNSGTSSCIVSYSDVEGGYPGTGNIDADPLFVDALEGNLRLQTGSLCIDSGDGDAAPSTDIEGNARYDDPDTTDSGTGAITYADMGAHEYQGPAVTVALPQAAMEGDGVLTGAGTVSVPSAVASDLAVTLSSDDTAEVTVPSPVTIFAGTSVSSFNMTIGNDAVRDGDKIVTVTGSAAGYVPGADTVTVYDDEMVVWHVDIDATGANDGTSWADAFLHPQDAMDFAISGDEVWVAEGTYTRRGSSDTVLLTMTDGVWIYGGFQGTESFRVERDWTAHVTTLDGESLVLHVVVGASDATLDGFTITDGDATGGATTGSGGGMHNSNVTNLSVANCTFSNSSADGYGGGMLNHNSFSLTVTNCTFSGNSTYYDGGGMCNRHSDATVTNCTFSGNWSYWAGGGMCNDCSSPTVTNCTFSGNTAQEDGGGGIYNNSSDPTVTNCILWGDTASPGPEIDNYNASVCTLRCSDVQGCGASGGGWDSSVGIDGSGNIDADPLFVDAANDDLHLQWNSPCIDTGTSSGAPVDDLDGNPRPSGSGYDMGAYEYQP